MAGFDNTTVFSSGERITTSSASDLLRMQETSDSVARINYTGNPEGNIAANPSSLCHDPVSGNIYAKQTGTGNTGWIHIGSQGSFTTTAVNYVVLNSDYYVGITATPVTITMPVNSGAGSPYVGQQFIFKDQSGTAGTNNITIVPNGGTIDGGSSFVINTNYGSVTLVFDGTNFFIL